MSDLHTAHVMARALGGQARGNRVVAPGPGHSRQDRSLSVLISADAPEGFTVHSFAGDDWTACREHVRQRLGLPEWRPGDDQDRRTSSIRIRKWDMDACDAQAAMHRQWNEDEQLRIRRARAIWDEAGDPRGSIGEYYLRTHRRLDLPEALCGTVLRFHPRCPWRDENTGETIRVPALVVPFRSFDDDSITAIHRIALRPDGTKIDRRMLGVVHGAAVKLDPLGDDLAIGEGVETAMAAHQLGIQPAWALGSVGAISFFPVLDRVKRLRILGETGKASNDAIQICARRWRRAGRRVQIIVPTVGSDLNDALVAVEEATK